MTKKEQEYLGNYEECFEQLRSDYNYAQDENKNLKAYIETLKELCKNNSIEILTINEPIPF